MTDYLVPTQSNVSHVETELAGLFALRTEILRVPLTLFNLYLSLDICSSYYLLEPQRPKSLWGRFRF